MNDEGKSCKSQRNINTVQYLLDKENSQRRKISEYEVQLNPRQNFVVAHQAETYFVNRAYIFSLYSPSIRLYYSKFIPVNKQEAAIGTICIIHGYGQSSDDYIEMANFFAKNRFVVNMIDLRGFGYSGGTRVFTNFRGLMSDIQNLLRRCCEIGQPTYIICHGFGSLLTFALLQENPNLPLSGVISLSPLFKFPCFSETSLLGKILLLGIELIWPQMLISNKINPTALTNNPHKLKGCLDGVFHYQFISISMGEAHNQLTQKVMKDAQKFTYPLFLLHGAKDTVQPLDDVKRFFQLVGSKQKSALVFKNGYHQLFQDERAEEQLFSRIIDWINDEGSKKNQIKWAVTTPFKLEVIKTIPLSLKYVLLSLLPVAIFLLIQIKNWIKFRKSKH